MTLRNVDRRILEVISVTSLVNFLTGFNARLAVVGLPTIASSIGADIWEMIWIIQGYMLGSTIVQLIIGRLADLYGRKRLFDLGILLFGLSALSAGLSPTPIALIISRFMQGVGGAFLMSLTVTILTDNVPKERLATWLGVNQVSWRIGALLGLTISGFIIDALGWRWIFLIQFPLSMAILLWSIMRLKDVYLPVEEKRLDIAGFALFTSSITTLLLSLTLFGYGFAELYLFLLIPSIILFAIFAIHETRSRNPALDFNLFRKWMFTGGIIAQLLYSIGFGASMTLLALYFQVVKGMSPSTTGLYLIPYELAYLLFGLVGGYLADRLGYFTISSTGLLLASASLLLLYKETGIARIILGETLLGVGTGLFVSPNTSSIMASVPAERRGVASSIRTISFNLGFILSLNIAIISITNYIPYKIASQLLMSGYVIYQNNSILELNSLEKGIRVSFLVQSIMMALAIPFSISRIRRKKVG
ncbi:MFS transporter [Thermogladius sp. 4427co]|uniref:MFS transporter n=1 Tax=Thermogladius sp. 4427co TaxID=3450718 RepID=UPI003F7A737E